MKLEGVYSVLPTPFTAGGEIDEDSLRRVVDLFVAAGVNGVTALGVLRPHPPAGGLPLFSEPPAPPRLSS